MKNALGLAITAQNCPPVEADGVKAVKTDKNRKDTYGFALIRGFSKYAEYADDEVNARFAEESAEAKGYDIFKDWAKPGCQSKDPFGPRQ